ncbi:hypothetical protein LCM20_12115 [Halobacillus litoralis]|uniref:hypothetical protein n=1 Tax=Halobacillus litoralis TaxID=45668 RepID=UPI001CD4375D|nr:hypothetical protein [Halobacillus litoralis]MCA0971343.1 hypothetical protein [Halobacillus litoralis]
MPSWKIGKLIFTQWKHRAGTAFKEMPLLGLIPFIILGSLAVVWFNMYQFIDRQLFSEQALLDQQYMPAYVENYANVTYVVITVSFLTLWQWGIKGQSSYKLFQGLPVRHFSWAIGQALPLITIMFPLSFLAFTPMLFVLLNQLSFTGMEQMLVVISFIAIGVAALFTGLFWQKAIQGLTIWISGTESRFVHGILFLSSTVFITLIGYLLFSRYPEAIAPVTPGFLLSHVVLNLQDGAWMWVPYMGALITSPVLFLFGAFTVFQLNQTRRDEPQGKVFFRKLDGPNHRFMSMILVDFKRLNRDGETLFYTLISLSLFFFGGLGLRWFELTLYLPIYEQICMYGLPFIIALYPLSARSKDHSLKRLIDASGTRPLSYVMSKLVIYAGFFPLLTIGLYVVLTGVAASTFTGNSYDVWMLSMVTFLTAYTIGSFLPAPEKSLSTKLTKIASFYFSMSIVILLYDYVGSQIYVSIKGSIYFTCILGLLWIKERKEKQYD